MRMSVSVSSDKQRQFSFRKKESHQPCATTVERPLPHYPKRMGPRRRVSSRRDVAPSRSRARASELQHSAEFVAERMNHSSRVSAQQRGVSEKEVLMAAKRATRQVATSTSTATATGTTRRLVETDTETTTETQAKRRRVGGSCDASHEDIRVEGSDERSSMEIDCVVLPAGPSPASPSPASPPFSPAAVSPSRRPWQLRPEPPETRPDAEGKLTRVWVHVLNSTRARSPRRNAHSAHALPRSPGLLCLPMASLKRTPWCTTTRSSCSWSVSC